MEISRRKPVMARPIMINLRNIYPPTDVAQHGFLYRSIGWPPAMELESEAQRLAAE